MEVHIQQAHHSHINPKTFENAWNEVHFNINRQRPRLSTSGVNDCDIDRYLPAYNEIHNNDDRSIPVTFDQTSLPSYETAVNWSIQRADTSVPIPDETLTIESAPNQPQLQRSCCSAKSKILYCICFAVLGLIILVALCILAILGTKHLF